VPKSSPVPLLSCEMDARTGGGESLFAGIDLPGLGYRVTETVPTEFATHLVLTR